MLSSVSSHMLRASCASGVLERTPDELHSSALLAEKPACVCRDAPFLAEVLTVKELHAPTAERSCIHVELDIIGSGIKYTAGDHVSHSSSLC